MNMKPIQIIFILILLFTYNLSAQNQGFGAGIILGDPTGLSAKAWLSEGNAVDFGLGYSIFPSNKKISLHADYLFHADGIKFTHGRIPIYYGFGARLRFRESKSGSFGARGVIGALYYFKEVPIDLFFEIVPVFQLLPETALRFDAGIGARYYFY
jgi:hypothetical protein